MDSEVMFELTYGKVAGHFLQEIPFVKIYFKEVMFELTYGKQKGDSSMQCTGASLDVSLNLTSVKYLQERNSCGEVSHKLD
jgi:hypothetical protein